jgi:hypothetical protein
MNSVSGQFILHSHNEDNFFNDLKLQNSVGILFYNLLFNHLGYYIVQAIFCLLQGC